jgi:hypothetical protein
MLDLALAYNRYRFLGDEFLTWLWFLIENDQKSIQKADPACSALEIGNRIVLENRSTKSVERITIKGDDAGLEEGRLALRKGALVSELSMIYKTNESQWQFSLKGESLNVSNLKNSGLSLPESSEEVETFLLDRSDQLYKILYFLEEIFKKFIHYRVSSKWSGKVVPEINTWIQSVGLK